MRSSAALTVPRSLLRRTGLPLLVVAVVSLAVVGVGPVAPASASGAAPIAQGDSVTVSEGGTATLLASSGSSVLANDTDDEDLFLTAVLVSGPARGTLVLNSDGTFSYTHDGSDTGFDSFSYRADDGTSSSNVATVTITVIPVNDAPIAFADAIEVSEGGTATTLQGGATSVLANDTDVELNVLTAVLVSGPAHGSLTLNANGTFSYTHNGSETTTDSFTYRANDGTVNSGPTTVTITVTPVDDGAPVGVGDGLTVAEGGTATTLTGGATSVLANDTDPDGAVLSAVLVTGPSNGTLVLDPDGTFSYTHDGSETTTDSFTYQADDGTTSSNTATVTITVTQVNDAPTAQSNSLSVLEGGTATTLTGGATSVLANDSDAENDVLTAVLVSGPAHGSLTLNANGTFSYTHNGSETTTDSFTYRANDGTVNSGPTTVTITVTPVDDGAPVGVDDGLTVAEGGTATTLTGGATSVLANDTDPDGAVLSAVLVTGPSNGTLTLNSNGTFSYTHDGSETTTDSFTYQADDGTTSSNTATVTITVTQVNDAPTAQSNSLTLLEGGTATTLTGGATSVLANDTDAENDVLTAVLVTGPTHGSLTLNANGTFSYTHNGSETTTDSFTYRANDGTVSSNTATVTITVTPVNDAPVAVDDSLTVVQDGTTSTLDGGATSVLANDSDAENGVLTTHLAAPPAHGTVVLGALGTFTYTPDPGYSGPDSFDYEASDGIVTSTATVSIAVTPATPTDAVPVAVPDAATVVEGGTVTVLAGGATSVLANDRDPDGYALMAVLVSDVQHGTLTLGPDGTFRYVHDGSESTTDSFTYRASDGTLSSGAVTVTITVTPRNSAPVGVADRATAAAGDAIAVLAGGATSVLANDTDPDGDALTVVLVRDAEHGTLTLNADGTFRYRPSAGYSGRDAFAYRADDGTATSNTVTVRIRVQPAGRCTITGTPGADVLVGTSGDDVICGGGGDDVLRGRAGDDVLRGGRGDDVLRGGPGEDVLEGGPGQDSPERSQLRTKASLQASGPRARYSTA
ncbi:Ig-like domain-containing protein [Nocardioides caricicola]|uniref:Ig-like domain-containing protein n=1 Tax=Nocardioides caricicola TaxID=634770 RepID=A0ABW0N3X0_9ACTN